MRSKEELREIISIFRDVFEDHTGHELNLAELRYVVSELLEEKERFLMKQRFLDFKPIELRMLQDELREKDQEPVKAEDQIKQIVKKVKDGKRPKVP